MAIQITFRSAIFSTSAGGLTCTPTWTPAANGLIVAFASTSYASSPVDPTGITGHGLTYSAMTLGTAYWVDLCVLAVTGGTATVTNIDLSAREVLAY